jgi:carbon monoxide dehydrogenase subunit G
MYDLAASVEIEATPEEVIRWLATPELMRRWMLGVSSIEADGDRIRVEVIHGGHAGWSYVGEIVERTTTRLVRRYGLATGGDDYERIVTYQCSGDGPVRVTASVVTAIPGLAESAARMGAKAEQKALERSLDRLRSQIRGNRGGWLARLRGSGGAGGPF